MTLMKVVNHKCKHGHCSYLAFTRMPACKLYNLFRMFGDVYNGTALKVNDF